MPQLPHFYAALANRSATSLRRWLPTARITVVLSSGDPSRRHEPPLPNDTVSAFDQVVWWSRPEASTVRHSWHEKSMMLAASQNIYGKA
eukprot:1317775-Prymnesium_polylepis.1